MNIPTLPIRLLAAVLLVGALSGCQGAPQNAAPTADAGGGGDRDLVAEAVEKVVCLA